MPEKAKTLYNSGLQNPTVLTVKSGAMVSKFGKKKPDDPGYEYIYVEINGQPFSYSAENRRCASTLAGYKGQEITVQAQGRGADAELVVTGAQEIANTGVTLTTIPTPSRSRSPEPLEDCLPKVLDMMLKIEIEVSKQIEKARLAGVPDEFLTAENFGGKCSQVFRELKGAGLI